MRKQVSVKVGDQFRHVIADGNPLWEVISINGDYATAVVIEGEDFMGTQKGFLLIDVARALKAGEFWAQSDKRNGDFYSTLRLGQTIHYNNGFKDWVRCVVVRGEDGKMVLKPIALLGEWRQFDLWTRMRDGSVMYGYQVQKIREGKTFTPHESCIYEAGCTSKGDPTKLTPLALEPPPMTVTEAIAAGKWRTVGRIRDAVEAASKLDNPDEALLAMQRVLSE